MWVFPKNRVGPQNGWFFIMENPIENGWFGGTTIFGNIHVVIQIWKLGNVSETCRSPWDLAIPQEDFDFIFQPSISRGCVSFREGTVPSFEIRSLKKLETTTHQKKWEKASIHYPKTTLVCLFNFNPNRVGGWTNPFEKYAQIGSFPKFSEVKNKKYLSCHHPTTNSPGEMGIRRVFVL